MNVSAQEKPTLKPSPAYSAQLEQGEQGQVARVIDGDSLVLENGLKVSLAGIQSPKMAWPDRNYSAWPLSQEAKAHLEKLVLGKTVRLYYGGDTRDRYGRALAQVWTLSANGEPELWLQKAMVGAGYARVYSWSGSEYDTQVLYAAEENARVLSHGIWNDAFYEVRTSNPQTLAQHADSMQLVEGRIVSTADVRGTIYLNFGTDYKTDFTVAIAKTSKRFFKKASYVPLELKGARIRARGWVELQNGPIIWLNDPRRLEILDTAPYTD